MTHCLMWQNLSQWFPTKMNKSVNPSRLHRVTSSSIQNDWFNFSEFRISRIQMNFHFKNGYLEIVKFSKMVPLWKLTIFNSKSISIVVIITAWIVKIIFFQLLKWPKKLYWCKKTKTLLKKKSKKKLSWVFNAKLIWILFNVWTCV